MPPPDKSAAAGRFAGRVDPSAAAFGLSGRHDDLSEVGDHDPARWLNCSSKSRAG